MFHQASTRSPGLLAALGRAVRVLFGLALLAFTAMMGLLLIGGLLLRSLFKRSGGPVVRVESAPRGYGGPSARRPVGEVVDIEAREVGPTVR
jgi:hypothetical protein